jgi:hypothetical protein
MSNWWPARTGHALPPIVDVPLAQGKEVRPAAFHCLRGSQASICSATLQQVLVKVTAATDVMKILIRPHLHRTLILNEHLHQCGLTLGSMEAVVCVSDVEWFLAHSPHMIFVTCLVRYHMNMKLPQMIPIRARGCYDDGSRLFLRNCEMIVTTSYVY